MDLFELNGRVVVDLADALKAFDKIQEAGQKSESKLSKFFSGVGKGAVVVGKAVGTGLAAGGAAMGALTVKALNLSGELEQNMGGSEQVFKDYAGKMQETARTAFSNMGLSTSEFLGTANKMGALFQGAGFDIESSSNMASEAMQRAADVASIMGIDTASAMEAIAGAAKGNFTMMDNLGVAMNDTTLNAYAMEKGLEITTKEMTNQEKIGLAMELFMERTAYAAGNYARENETLAGALGTAKSALTNFLDGSGDVDSLVSSFSNAANVIVKNLSEIAPRLVSGITDIINQIIPMLPPLLQQLLPVIVEGAVSLINGLVAALPMVLDALLGALPALIQGVQTIINALIEALPQLIESLAAALPTLIPMLVDALVSMIVTLCTMLPEIIIPILDYLPEIIISIVDALMQNLPVLIDGAVQLVVGLVAALPEIILALLDALPDIVISIVNGLLAASPTLIEGVGEIVTSVITALWDFLSGFPESVTNYVTAMWDNLSNVTNGVWEAIKTAISTSINAVKTNITTVFNGVKNTVSNIWNGIKTSISSIWNNIKSTATSVWDGVMNAIKKPMEKARDLVKGAIDKIKGFFKFDITWPKIKMPHFGISPSGWKIGDLLKGSIPKLKIDWYAEGGVMKRPTLFDYNPATGTAKVGGENGAEAVAPIDTLQQYIKVAVAEQNSGVIQKLERIINLLVQFFPEMLEALNISMYLDGDVLVAETAPAMNMELGKIAIKKDRGR